MEPINETYGYPGGVELGVGVYGGCGTLAVSRCRLSEGYFDSVSTPIYRVPNPLCLCFSFARPAGSGRVLRKPNRFALCFSFYNPAF